jgi:SRSO17 transposase
VTPKQLRKLEDKLTDFVDEMTVDLGRPERRRAMGWYVSGLLLDGERKSIQPMAARLVTDDREAEAMRQRLQQCVVVSGWDEEEVRRRLARKVDDELPDIEAFVIDDTGFPKKGKHSVGVHRQYSGTLGRTDNCQVATSLHLVGGSGSAMIGMQLYLPKAWTDDRQRCQRAGVPTEVAFQTKGQIALQLLDRALSWGVRKHVVLMDAGYGDSPDFRDAVRDRGLHHIAAVASNHLVWPPGSHPRLPHKTKKLGRPRTRYRDGNLKPRTIEQVAQTLTYQEVTWQDGSPTNKSAWFAAVRVRSAEGHAKGRPPSEEQWLLCEWLNGQDGPTKFHFSSLPADTSLRKLVRLTRLRWRVERDYQELKGEIGLDHFEGRTWRGFHHHVTLCAVAHAFLALHRALSPPGHSSLDTRGRPSRPSTSHHKTRRRVPLVQATS